MNSRNTTLPRKVDRVMLWPVRYGGFGPTTGKVKSRLLDDAVLEEVTVGGGTGAEGCTTE
jgi:hypothetical protein